MTTYRKIYEHHFGPIPLDEFGRSYEIHHIDGDHTNNLPSNLKAVSIQEHYNIHLSQGDYYAALLISSRMNLDHKSKSELARLNAFKQIENGKNGFINSNKTRMLDGTHHFLNKEYQENVKNIMRKKLLDGTHHMIGNTNNKRRIELGTHNFIVLNSIQYHCLVCDKTGKGPAFKANHFPKCEAIIPHSGPRGKIKRTKNPTKLECPHCHKMYDPGNLKRHLTRIAMAEDLA
jgi:hypothetical protein